MPWGVFSTVGDIMMHVGGYLEYRGDIHSVLREEHDKCGGYLECRGGYHDIPHGTQITKDGIPHGTERPHCTYDIPHVHHDNLHGTQDNPHDTHDIPHGTDHPHGTQDIPHIYHDSPTVLHTPAVLHTHTHTHTRYTG